MQFWNPPTATGCIREIQKVFKVVRKWSVVLLEDAKCVTKVGKYSKKPQWAQYSCKVYRQSFFTLSTQVFSHFAFSDPLLKSKSNATSKKYWPNRADPFFEHCATLKNRDVGRLPKNFFFCPSQNLTSQFLTHLRSFLASIRREKKTRNVIKM